MNCPYLSSKHCNFMSHHTTYRGSLASGHTRNRAFPDALGFPGFSSQRLGSSVGFGPADAQGAEEKKRVMPNDLRKGQT